MNSEVLDGGQGRNRTTDTRIFRDLHASAVTTSTHKGKDWAWCCLFRPDSGPVIINSPRYLPGLATTQPISAAP
jgi:hypothetical protein